MMRRTSASDILLPFIGVAAVVYVLLKLTYSSLPPFEWFTAVPIGALAIAEFVIARRVRLAVRHAASARPMTALAIARSVALGKASSLVGSGIAGAAFALIVKVQPDSSRTTAANHDLWVGVVLLVASAALAAAGLVLERAGIDPNRDRRD
ncbi:DUF3180 domain-containing protein [Jatrophihabitans sp. DSM 45814]